jgi:hypothetical protein
MALPAALALGWLLVASAPAVKYKASARVESIVRTPLLTELASSRVVNDVVLAPRLDGFLYTNLLDVKFVYEPQLLVRQATSKPTLEILQSVFTTADYKLRRDLRLLAVHTTTYGTFPFDNYGSGGDLGGGPVEGGVPSGGELPVTMGAKAKTAYIYTETAVGFWTSLGIKRLAIAGTLGWVVNGLLSDPPTRPVRRGDASYPLQRYPELRVQSFYGATRRDYFTLSLYGKDVSYSTGNRSSLLQFAPGLQHFFSPLVNVSVDPGVAVGMMYPRRPDQPREGVLMPTLETALNAPVPLGNHWPVRAKLRARYLPHLDPLTTRLIPRGDVGVSFKWEGQREAKVLGELSYAHALTDGLHRNDAQTQAEVEALWPLPLSRYLYAQAKGKFTWTHHVVLDPAPVVQWYTSVGLVVRYDRGRL